MTLYVVQGRTIQARDQVDAAQIWAAYLVDLYGAPWIELRRRSLAPEVILVQDAIFRRGVLCAGPGLWCVRL